MLQVSCGRCEVKARSHQRTSTIDGIDGFKPAKSKTANINANFIIGR